MNKYLKFRNRTYLVKMENEKINHSFLDYAPLELG